MSKKIIVVMRDTVIREDGSEEVTQESRIPMETYIDPETGIESVNITNTVCDYKCGK